MNSNATATRMSIVEPTSLCEGTRYVPWGVLVEQLEGRYVAAKRSPAASPARLARDAREKKRFTGVGYARSWSLLAETPGH